MKTTNIIPSIGTILISEPSLQDFYFARSVVLLAEHNEEGSFGIILNKPVNIKFNEIVSDFPHYDGKVFLGGPVSTKNLFYIHTKGDLIENSQRLSKDLFWGGNIEDVKILLDSKLLDSNSIRFFVGYAGWTANQLNDELKIDSWLVAKANHKKLISYKPEEMWKNAIKDLGSDYVLWANFPADPGLN
jgi:putative transcriptional regulator